MQVSGPGTRKVGAGSKFPPLSIAREKKQYLLPSMPVKLAEVNATSFYQIT